MVLKLKDALIIQWVVTEQNKKGLVDEKIKACKL